MTNKYKQGIARHKRRLDRGGIYWGYFQMISTGAILVRVFQIDQTWVYVAGLILIFAFRYICGYLEDKKGILSAEQESYSELNPINTKMFKYLEEIKQKLERLENSSGNSDTRQT